MQKAMISPRALASSSRGFLPALPCWYFYKAPSSAPHQPPHPEELWYATCS